MIEQAMIFVLGFCVAGLLALLALPAVSRRALRFAREDVERQMPLSIDEIVAQRDLLRAEYAVRLNKRDQTLRRVRDAHAVDRAELGRRAARIAGLESELADTRRARDAMELDLAQAARAANEARAEAGATAKALYDAQGGEETWRLRHAALRDEHAALGEEARRRAEAITDLEAALERDRAAAEAVERELLQARLDLSVARAREEGLLAEAEGRDEGLRQALATIADLRRRLATAESAAAAPDPADTEALRRAIVEIGEEILRLSARSREERAAAAE